MSEGFHPDIIAKVAVGVRKAVDGKARPRFVHLREVAKITGMSLETVQMVGRDYTRRVALWQELGGSKWGRCLTYDRGRLLV